MSAMREFEIFFMRILYISGETVPGKVGGSVHVWEVAKNLQKLGHKLTLLVSRSSEQGHIQTIEGIKILRTKIKLLSKTMPILHLIKILHIQKPDLIIERYSIVGGFGAMLSKFYGSPLIIEVNGPHLYEAKYLGQISDKIKIVLKKWSDFQFSQAKKIIAPIQTIVPEKFKKKYCQIEWGVNTELFKKTKKTISEAEKLRNSLKIKGFTILFHGSFRQWHGIEDLIGAAKILKEEKMTEKITFVLIGKGNLLEYVEKKIKDYKLFNIRLIQEVNYEELPKYLAIADVGIAPFNTNKYEPLKVFGFYWSPLKIFEYSAMSLPVIIPAISRLKQLVGEKNFFYKEGNVESLINAIKKAFHSKNLKQIGLENRVVAKKYSWLNHAKKLNELIKTA